MPLMFGCIPCTTEQVAFDEQHRPLRTLVGSGVSSRDISLRRFLDEVLDQGDTSTCVANAISSACAVSNAAKGHPIKRPSRRWLYDLAQWTSNPGRRLVDEGSSAFAMCNGAMRHGLVSEERFPFDPARVTEPAPFDLDVSGQDALALDYWRASTDPEELKLALSRNEVPCIAIPVHDNFIHWGSDEPYSETAGEFRGFHMVALVGFEGGSFDVLNSWGSGWCRDGFISMTADFIRRQAFDRVVIRSAPAPR